MDNQATKIGEEHVGFLYFASCAVRSLMFKLSTFLLGAKFHSCIQIRAIVDN